MSRYLSRSVRSNGTRLGRIATRHAWQKCARPVALAAAALGLTLGAISASASSAGAASHPSTVTTYAKYVGGHGKANPKLAPVTIGVVNQQTGTESPAPTWTTGAKLAVKYINKDTGGIDGHPLEAVYCAIPTSVSSATSCGQEFANDGAIAAVAVGPVAIGNTGLESALSPTKKPMFFGISISPVDDEYPYGFILYDDAIHVDTPMATFAKTHLHAKSVSLVYPSSVPGDSTIANTISAALKYEGVSTVYSAGFTSSVSDLTEPFEASHVGSTTLLISISSGGPACSDTYLTLKSLDITTKVLTAVPCDTPTIAAADGGQLPTGWYYLAGSPVPGSTTKEISSFEKVATEFGDSHLAGDPWLSAAFGEVLTIAKLDTEIEKAGKKITPATVSAKAKAFKGPVVDGSPHLHCGGFPGFPALCNDLATVYQNTAPGTMKLVSGWIGPPNGFKGSSSS